MSPTETMQFIDDSWHDAALARAGKLYPNSGVDPLSSLLARTGRYAIDYLEQAPALIVYAAWGVKAARYNERLHIAERFGEAVRRGVKLKGMLERYHAPFPIRKLSGAACIPSNYKAIIALRSIPASDLAQAIPDTVGAQLAWLRFLRDWNEVCKISRGGIHYQAYWLWGVKAAGVAARDKLSLTGHASSIADFLGRGEGSINPAWSMKACLAAVDRWHRELAEKQDQEKFLQSHGFAFSQERDYAPLPNEWSTAGYIFTALRSGMDLFLEGKAMRHCVASYVREVMLGGTRIYSMRNDQGRVATVELRPFGERFILSQAKRACNLGLRKDETAAVKAFIREVNECIREAS